MAVRISN